MTLYHRQCADGDVAPALSRLTVRLFSRFLQCSCPGHRQEEDTQSCFCVYCFLFFLMFLYFFFLVCADGLLFERAFSPLPSTSVLLECTDSFREKRKAVGETTTMSFKSLKEFGVSAERLGSICKRWMARVQRFVLCVCVRATLKCPFRISSTSNLPLRRPNSGYSRFR